MPPGERAEDGESSESANEERTATLVGQTGIATSLLGFAGVARIDGRRVNVIAEGECVTPGTAVRVVEVDGSRVVVRRA